MDETKHSPLPWAVRPKEFDDWGIIRDAMGFIAAVARRNATSPYGDDDLHRINGTDPFQPNAGFIVLACNAYYSDQATIAAQAARIKWLERPVSDEDALEAKNNYPELLDDHHGLMKRYHINTLLTAALEFRLRAAK